MQGQEMAGGIARDWLVGGGELGELIRATDWSKTAFGPRDQWPQSLRTALNLVVASRFPMSLVWGRDLLLLYNDAYRIIAADRHPAALGRSTRDIWAEVWHINEPIFAAVTQRGEPQFFEDKPYRIHRSGRWEDATFTICYSPVYVEDGSIGGTLVVLEDSTARLRLDRKLRQATADLEEAQAVARIGSWKLSHVGGAVSWSKELFRIVDVDPNDFDGSHDSFLSRVHPEDRARLLQANRDAMQKGIPFSIEYRIMTRTGGERWIRGVGSARLGADGQVTGLVGTSQDITEQRHATERLRESEARQALLLQLSDRMHAIEDPDAQKRMVCTLLGEHLGADRVHYGEHHAQEDVIVVHPDYFREGLQSLCGRYPVEFFGEMPPFLRTGRTAVIPDTETSPELGERSRAAFRALRVRSLIAAPLVSGGKLTWSLTVISNTPRQWTRDEVLLVEEVGNRTWSAFERARASAALRQANLQLEDADRRKTAFWGLLSHELRNPLAPIANSLYILDHALPGGEQAGRAKAVIGRQVAQLSRLVNELLEMTRLSQHKIQLRKERLELNEVLGRTIEDYQSLFERAGVQLTMVPAPQQVFVLADRVRIIQIVGNLLQNSAKFTSPGGSAQLTIETLSGYAVVRVKDSGIGMDAVTTVRAFEPFMQADGSLDRSDGGLGIGLALVKGLVELHGGTVGAHSDGIGKGSEFVVRLPLDASLPKELPATDGWRGLSHKRVLVIEDNVDAAETLREALELSGYDVEVALNGTDGIAMARESVPDVLLCDIGLPGIDGYEVARVFREDRQLRGVRLVALSGYALPQDLQRAADAGFEVHLAKPVSVEKLVQVIGAADGR